MYDLIKNVINSGRYSLPDMLKKIDTIWVQGDITDDQRNELITLARENADVSQSMDVLKKLKEIDQRVTKLESAAEEPAEPAEDSPAYVPGKWYYKGDRITYNSKRYTCIAPEGQACTWSPEEYPAYWEADD